MKRFLFFSVAVMLFAACSKDAIDEQQGIQNIVDEAPATLTVGFENDETRIQLNEAKKTVWTNGDLVSVFYRSNANQKWQYTGETGARTADLTRVDAGEATATMNRVVVVYPYNENYYFNTETYNVQASLPATQTYLKDSYGLDGNIMVSSSEFNQFKLKTVYGWLKLQLTGNGEQVKSITVCGNDGEQVAGDVVINTPDATITLAADGDKSDATIFTEVTLDCGEGVELGAEATAFYIALPPQTFTKGLTVEITAIDGSAMTQSTDNEVVIERNHIKPMTTFGYNGIFKPANNEIWYTNGSTTERTAPYKPNNFGGATIQSNLYDAEKECWVITFDKDIKEIGNSAFYNRSITSVTIPDSVTTIGEQAFIGCESLTSVTIGNSVTTIGGSAFAGCNSLKEFKGKLAADGGRCLIIDGVLNAFAIGCGVTQYTIPDNVTKIGDDALLGCTSLTSVTIPDSVTTIGERAFGWCSSLKTVYCKPTTPPTGGYHMFYLNASGRKIYVPASDDDSIINAYKAKYRWSDYDDYIFEEGPANNEIWYTNGSTTAPTAPNSTTAFGDATIQSNTYDAEKKCWVITFDKDITEIGKNAFRNCTRLTSVTIPDSVTTIGWCAFNCCSSLTSVTIPDSVTTIGEYAFYYCFRLKEFKGKFAADGGRCLIMDNTIIAYAEASGTTYTIPNSVTTIGNGAFDNCDSLTSVTIPDSVTTIGESAFSDCESLTSVTIPNSVTTIGSSAFYYCKSLTSVTIPDSVTTIGKNAFRECRLTSVTIGNSVTTIGEQAFYYCGSLTSVNIPDSVTTIGNYAFYGCSSLKTVYCKRTTPPTGGYNMFGSNAAGRSIFVPASGDDSIINAYKAKEYWSDYADYIEEDASL